MMYRVQLKKTKNALEILKGQAITRYGRLERTNEQRFLKNMRFILENL